MGNNFLHTEVQIKEKESDIVEDTEETNDFVFEVFEGLDGYESESQVQSREKRYLQRIVGNEKAVDKSFHQIPTDQVERLDEEPSKSALVLDEQDRGTSSGFPFVDQRIEAKRVEDEDEQKAVSDHYIEFVLLLELSAA